MWNVCRESILFLIRGLRFCCFIAFVSHWHLMAQTVVHLISATARILALQFTVCTLFSLLGVHLFGGKVHLRNRLLEDPDYATGRFYAFNYNDYASAMVTSTCALSTTGMYVIMDAFASVTGTAWSRVFFKSFLAVAVAFTLNVVVSIFCGSIRFANGESWNQDEKGPSLRQIPVWSPTHGRPLGVPHNYSCYDLYEYIVKK